MAQPSFRYMAYQDNKPPRPRPIGEAIEKSLEEYKRRNASVEVDGDGEYMMLKNGETATITWRTTTTDRTSPWIYPTHPYRIVDSVPIKDNYHTYFEFAPDPKYPKISFYGNAKIFIGLFEEDGQLLMKIYHLAEWDTREEPDPKKDAPMLVIPIGEEVAMDMQEHTRAYVMKQREKRNEDETWTPPQSKLTVKVITKAQQ